MDWGEATAAPRTTALAKGGKLNRAALFSLASLAALSGCDLINMGDPREGTEAVGDCVKRVTDTLTRSERELFRTREGVWIPTYTYDVTKMDLDEVQELIVVGSDETAGSRGKTSTNKTSTAVERFMQRPVDEKGAFFLGRDPALYRVRGEPAEFGDLITAGCERQKSEMRLISLSWDETAQELKVSTDVDPNELDARGAPMEYDLKEKNN